MYLLKILCEISKVPFEILHEILKKKTPQTCILRGVESLINCDILELWHPKS